MYLPCLTHIRGFVHIEDPCSNIDLEFAFPSLFRSDVSTEVLTTVSKRKGSSYLFVDTPRPLLLEWYFKSPLSPNLYINPFSLILSVFYS